MDEMQQDNDESVNQSPQAMSGGGYGRKGGWKKWLLIYVVIAVVVYGIIYFFFMRDAGTGTPTIGY